MSPTSAIALAQTGAGVDRRAGGSVDCGGHDDLLMVVIVAVSIISHARRDIAPVSCPGLHTSRVHGRVRLASGHQEGPSTPRISIRSRTRSG